MKVLVSAYACEPGKGSEPEVGWQWVRQIARFHETWVITRSNNQQAIEDALKLEAIDKLNFVYYDLPDWVRVWKRKQRGVHLYHQIWQYKIMQIAQKLHKQHRFDICHHITFGVVWHPSFFYKLPTIIIWGPFGGGEVAYKGCVKEFSFYGKIQEYFRKILSAYFFRFDPIVRKNFNKASLLLARTDMTAKEIPLKYLSKTKIFLETGFQNNIEVERNPFVVMNDLFTISRLIPLKNISIAILAMKLIVKKMPSVRLHICGDGPLREDLMKLVKDNGLKDKIIFHGQIEHKKLLDMIKDMAILIHPSVREGGSHAIIESMALGIPVVCLDNAGPGYMVDNNSGIKVTGGNRKEIILGFANAVLDLLNDKEHYNRLSTGAKNRVNNHFLWSYIGDRLNALYNEVYKEAGIRK